LFMAQRYKFSIESKSIPLYISGEPELRVMITLRASRERKL
jgi:hypothetical protein